MKKKFFGALIAAVVLTAAPVSPQPELKAPVTVTEASAYDECDRLPDGWAKGLCIMQHIIDGLIDDMTRDW